MATTANKERVEGILRVKGRGDKNKKKTRKQTKDFLKPRKEARDQLIPKNASGMRKTSEKQEQLNS